MPCSSSSGIRSSGLHEHMHTVKDSLLNNEKEKYVDFASMKTSEWNGAWERPGLWMLNACECLWWCAVAVSMPYPWLGKLAEIVWLLLGKSYWSYYISLLVVRVNRLLSPLQKKIELLFQETFYFKKLSTTYNHLSPRQVSESPTVYSAHPEAPGARESLSSGKYPAQNWMKLPL